MNIEMQHLMSCALGQVQSKKCIEEVLHFAYEENLFVMADEVNSAVDVQSNLAGVSYSNLQLEQSCGANIDIY